MPLSVCLISSELSPLAKSGGLADVSGALADYLHTAGHDVRVFMPGYAQIDRSSLQTRPVGELHSLQLEVGLHRYAFSVTAARTVEAAPWIYLIDCPELFARNDLYTFDADEHRRFLMLTR